MLSLQAQTREISRRKVEEVRKQEKLPAVLYGPKIKNVALVLDYKDFEKAYEEAGESTLIKLKVGEKEFQVLIHDVQKHPVTEKFTHVDFYQPKLEEKVTATVPLAFEGEPPAIKELGAVLVKNISELEVEALPQNLPKEIKVDVSELKTLDSVVHIKDLVVPAGVEILKEPEEIVALITPPEEEIVEEKQVEVEAPVKEEKKPEKEEEN